MVPPPAGDPAWIMVGSIGGPVTFPRLLMPLSRRFDALALRLAGRAAFADLEHVGRRTGTVRHTPVRAFRRGDAVVIGVNFGNRSDWVQNVLAAGSCRMHLGRELLDLTDPRLVPVADGVRDMPRLFGLGLRFVVRTRECLRLTVTPPPPPPSS